MIQIRSSNRLLGAVVFAFGVCCLLFWIPNDIDSGLIETVRRRNVIGDSLLPAGAMILIGLSAIALMRQKQADTPFHNDGKWHHVFGFFVIIFVVTLLIMRFAGPALVGFFNLFAQDDVTYRNVRNVRPLKYAGFILGGTVLLSCFSHFMDKSLTKKRAGLFLLITAVIAAFFDLPFEDILLPPNGDV